MAEEVEIMYIDTEVLPTNNMAIFQQEKAALERAMEWAKKYPRAELKIKNALIALVTNDKDLAESCTYTVPRSGNPTGPSAVLARLFLRKWGNVRAESRVVGFDATHVTAEATVIDLEVNFGIRVQVRRSIMTSKGARYDETTAATTGQAGAEIALRNAVFKIVEPSILKAVHDAAKRKVIGKCDSKDEIIALREKYVNGLKELYKEQNLTDSEIAAACGKKLLEHLGKDELLSLATFESGLRKGDLDFETVFRSKKPVEPVTIQTNDAKIEDRIKKMIAGAKTPADLKKLEPEIKTNDLRILYDAKFAELK